MDNEMLNERYLKLAQKWLDGSITEAEKAEFNTWYHKDQDAPVVVPPAFAIDEQQQRDRMFATVQWGEQRPVIRLWPRILTVVAAVTVITLGVWLYYTSGFLRTKAPAVMYTTDVNPGKEGATLTLSNGEKIRLSEAGNGNLARESGITIRKSAEGQLIYEFAKSNQASGLSGAPTQNTLSTARGETYRVVLPDGSLVWLNAASDLTFSASSITAGKRLVTLKGEAYFEIAKDAVHPFVVEIEGQTVEVLGTHFNINGYEEQAGIKTTLLEGSVRVSAKTTSLTSDPAVSSITLKPNQESVLTKSRFVIRRVNPDEAVAWKNGYFDFNEERLESIMNKIARWYDLEVTYENARLKDQIFTGNISRSNTVSLVLKKLAMSNVVRFKLEGRHILVTE